VRGNFVLKNGSKETVMDIVSERARGTLTKPVAEKVNSITKAIKAMDKGMGVQWARTISTTENGKSYKDDGVYDPITHTMYIALDSERPYTVIAGHELSHALEGTEAFNVILNDAINTLKKNGVYDEKLAKAKTQYGEKSNTFLNQEIVADKIGELFNNPAELKRLVNSRRGVVGKLINALDTLIGKLKGVPKAAQELTALRQKLQAAMNETRDARRAHLGRDGRARGHLRRKRGTPRERTPGRRSAQRAKSPSRLHRG
jgi:hypothetical protein